MDQSNWAAKTSNLQNLDLAAAAPAWRAARQSFERLFDLASDGLLVTDAAGTIQEANLTAAQVLNTPRHLLPGQSLIEFVAETNRNILLNHLAALQFDPEAQVVGLEVTLQPPSAAAIHKWLTIAPVRNNVGRLFECCWLLKDTSNTAQAEQALRHSEELFRLITENAADLIAVVDAQGQRLYNSPSYETVLGYSTQELKESWAFAEIHPEDRARVMEAAQETFRTGIGRVVEYRMRHKNGSWRELQSSGGVIRNSLGEIESVVVVAHDITERKQVEEELQRRANEFAALYQTIRDLADFQDLPTLLQMIVERATSLLAAPSGAIYLYDPAQGEVELVVAKNFPLSLGTRVKLGQGMTGRVAQSRQPLLVDNYQTWEYRMREYEHLPVRAAVQVPMLYGGELIGVLDVNELDPGADEVMARAARTFSEADARLLTLFAGQAASVVNNARLFEQVRTGRERLKILSSRLMEAQEVERRNIARELHDEIGQSLTAIHLNLQAALTSSDPLAVAPRLEDSMLSIEQVLQQVRNLSLDLRPSLLDDFGLVPALRWYVNRQAKRAGLSAELIADGPEQKLRPELATACFRFTQEALTNVVRHAHARHVRIEIKQSGAELQISIVDDGIGFDVDTALQRATLGASLGLLGMQERVLLVGGRVNIESAANEGTRINAFFPLALRQKHLERRTKRQKSS